MVKINETVGIIRNKIVTFWNRNKALTVICAFLTLVLITAMILVFKNEKVKKIVSTIEKRVNTEIETEKADQNSENLEDEETVGTVVDENYQLKMDFAKYELKKTTINPTLDNHSINSNEITNLANFEKILGRSFSEEQKKAINENNFLVIKNNDKFWNDDIEGWTSRYDDWTYLYDQIGGSNNPCYREPENAVFITSDFLLHVYHRLLEKEFEYIENSQMFPILRKMTTVLFDKTVEEYPLLKNESDKLSYQRITAYLAVPKSILDSANGELGLSMADQKLDTDENVYAALEKIKSKMPKEAYDLALAELKLVLENKQISPSPIFGKYLSEAGLKNEQDYTQFTPRSHYTKNSVLRSYFRAMMWYGRNYFAVNSKDLTRDAANLTLIFKKSGQLKNWESIYNPTAFLVGKSDDLGVKEYQEILNKFNIRNIDDSSLDKIQSELKNYQGPKIMSSIVAGDKVFTSTKQELLDKTKGFRLMGQRFTPDAFIFTSLTQGDELPDPETGQKLPSSTTALMVMSIMGNKTADGLTQEWIKNNASSSDKVLAKNMTALRGEFDKLSQDTWTQNIYWGWLYTLKSLNQEDTNKNGYPNFMKNGEWNKKNLLSSLGSWTELKHDTLLYAKQNYAEAGGGGDECEIKPVVRGYVEPNIEFYDRLLALIKMTDEGLKKDGLIDESVSGRNERLAKEVEFYKTIAVKQLQNETISDDEFESLRNSPGYLDTLLMNISQDASKEKDARSALIADVHTDAVESEILYEANGLPNYILVAVKDKNGTRLTRGLVYDYYEFTGPLGERMKDEDWQKINYTTDKTKLPKQPDWVKSLYR